MDRMASLDANWDTLLRDMFDYFFTLSHNEMHKTYARSPLTVCIRIVYAQS